MLIKANVYLLPTEISIPSKVSIWRNCKTNELSFWKDYFSMDKNWYGFHVYIALPQSDLEISKIKKGDWVYNSISREDYQITILEEVVSYEEKVVATSDKLQILKRYLYDDGNKFYLPSISQQSIEHFIYEYNKGNKIKEVEIELECEQCVEWGYVDSCKNDCSHKFMHLKLNQSDEISISLF